MLNSIAYPNRRRFNTELADNTVQYRTFLPPLQFCNPTGSRQQASLLCPRPWD